MTTAYLLLFFVLHHNPRTGRVQGREVRSATPAASREECEAMKRAMEAFERIDNPLGIEFVEGYTTKGRECIPVARPDPACPPYEKDPKGDCSLPDGTKIKCSRTCR